jgi:hypothetical protein
VRAAPSLGSSVGGSAGSPSTLGPAGSSNETSAATSEAAVLPAVTATGVGDSGVAVGRTRLAASTLSRKHGAAAASRFLRLRLGSRARSVFLHLELAGKRRVRIELFGPVPRSCGRAATLTRAGSRGANTFAIRVAQLKRLSPGRYLVRVEVDGRTLAARDVLILAPKSRLAVRPSLVARLTLACVQPPATTSASLSSMLTKGGSYQPPAALGRASSLPADTTQPPRAARASLPARVVGSIGGVGDSLTQVAARTWRDGIEHSLLLFVICVAVVGGWAIVFPFARGAAHAFSMRHRR